MTDKANIAEALDEIEEGLADGARSRALALLSELLAERASHLDAAAWSRALGLVGPATGSKAASSLQAAVSKASSDPEEPEFLLELGTALVEENRPAVAAGVLTRARQLAPENVAILAELVAALEFGGRNQEAVETLDVASELVENSPLLTYLRAFNAVLIGDLETPERLLPQIRLAKSERFRFMAGRIERMLSRAKALFSENAAPTTDLRAWHFVLTGGILLQLAPEAERHGRYGHRCGTLRDVLEGLERLAAVLDALGVEIGRILYPPERSSQIVAHAAGAILECSTAEWFGGEEPGLIVIYDPAKVIPELRQGAKHHRPGQPYFAHALQDRREHRVAPDVVGYLHERDTPPWGPGFGPENEFIEPDTRLEEAIARDIVGAEARADSGDLEALLAFTRTVAELPASLRPEALQDAGTRDRVWVGSPVDRAQDIPRRQPD